MSGLRLAGEVVKAAAAGCMTRAAAGQRLPATDNRIDVESIELQPVATAAGALGGDQGRAAAEKGVEHDVAAGRAVEDRVGNHCYGLHGWVQRQEIALLAATGEGVGSRVMPDIAAVAPVLAELDIVAVPVAAMF